jgi:cytoskeleton protein RodZ
MASFGERLKKEREQKGISLEDISLETKIGTRLLRALEEEHFDQLPGGIFNKCFVRAYARHLGLDEEQTIADYMAAIGPPPVTVEEKFPVQIPHHEPPREHPSRNARSGPPSEIPWGVLAVLLLVVALGFASWTYFHRPRAESRQGPVPATTQPTPVSSPLSDSHGGESTKPAETQPSPSVPPDTGRPISSIPAKEPATSNAAPVSQAALHGSSASPLVNATAGTFSVRLKGNDDSEECWVSVSVDGQPAVESTLIAPYEKIVEAKNEVIVRVGNAGALDIFFNGQHLPSQGDLGVVRTLVFHPNGLQPPVPKPTTPSPH